MKNIILLIPLLVITIFFAGCDQHTSTLGGAAVGTAMGAGIGNAIGGDTGATALGAVLGGLAGAAIGSNEGARHEARTAAQPVQREVVYEETCVQPVARTKVVQRTRHCYDSELRAQQRAMERKQRAMERRLRYKERELDCRMRAMERERYCRPACPEVCEYTVETYCNDGGCLSFHASECW